jgi:Lrp/AsnC family leucine-responsive transcriptional regulator
MDETDLRLSQLLLLDSRAPYQELAGKLGLSVQAVHRRIQALVKCGVIAGFTAHLSYRYLGAVNVGFSGLSEARSLDDVVEKLHQNDSTNVIIAASGNWLVVSSILRNLSEAEAYTDFLRKAAAMPTPGVGMVGSMQYGTDSMELHGKTMELGSLDFRIVQALHADSRKSIADISTEVGISAKTVKRHLEAMDSMGVIEYRIDWHPGQSDGIVAFVWIRLKPGTDRAAFRNGLARTFGARMIFITSFCNDPVRLLCFTWSPNGRAFSGLCDSLEKDAGVEKVTSFYAQKGYVFETWRDRLLAERSKGAR